MQFFFDPLAVAIILALQQLLPFAAWYVINNLSSDIVYVGLLGIAYWCLDKREGRVAVNLLMFSSFINILLKYAFHMPRPDPSLRPNPEDQLDTSYGFPSGAVQTASTFWGWASLKLRRWWLWILAIVFVVLSALARMALGMHWLGDVIGGAIVGIIIVVLAYFIVPWFMERWEGMPRLAQDWLLPLLALIFFGIFQAAYSLLLIPYFPSENIAVSMGVILGFGAGSALEERYVSFSTDMPRNTLILRAILGLVVALIVYFGFSTILELLAVADIFAVRFIKYIIVGFTGAFLIPLLFKVIGR